MFRFFLWFILFSIFLDRVTVFNALLSTFEVPSTFMLTVIGCCFYFKILCNVILKNR